MYAGSTYHLHSRAAGWPQGSDVNEIAYLSGTFSLQVEPRVAGGNVNLEGPIDHTLDPFRAATSAPFIVAGELDFKGSKTIQIMDQLYSYTQ